MKKEIIYTIKRLRSPYTEFELEQFLNMMGEEEWELCHLERCIDASVLIFKKSLPATTNE